MCQQHREVLNLKLDTLQVAKSAWGLFPAAIESPNRFMFQETRSTFMWPQQSFTEFTYGDDDGGDESPADFEEERRREAQHHLDVFKVVPVTCDKKQKGIQEKCKVNIRLRSFILDLGIDIQYSMYWHMKAEDEESAGALPSSFSLRWTLDFDGVVSINSLGF